MRLSMRWHSLASTQAKPEDNYIDAALNATLQVGELTGWGVRQLP